MPSGHRAFVLENRFNFYFVSVGAAEGAGEAIALGVLLGAGVDVPEDDMRFNSSNPGKPERSGTITIAIRRFSERPSGVPLSAIGS